MMHARSQPRPALPLVGETLDDRFELRAVIGEGGMGHVYRAYDHQGAREVALKLLAPRYLGRPERVRRFLREAELGRRARHRNLVEYLDAGHLSHDDWPFVSMEIIEGKELGRQLARGALPLRLAARVARQLAGAVLALHRVGVVHRDVTPMNVLMRGDDAVLIDLSHAGDTNAPQLAVGDEGRLTQPHEVPGTHYYMSREQAQAAPAHPAMDVYAFGMTLVEMLTGRAPSGWDRETFIAMQREGKFAAPRVDVRVHRDVPAELAELAHACTSAEPAARPTFDEIVRHLDAVLAGLGEPAIEAMPRRSPVMSEMLAASTARPRVHRVPSVWVGDPVVDGPRPADDEPVPAHETSRRGLWLGVALLVLLGTVVGGWALWPRGERTDAERGQVSAETPSPELEVVAPPKPETDQPAAVEASGGQPEDDPPTQAMDLGSKAVEPEPGQPTKAPGDSGSVRAPSKPRPADTAECARTREKATQAVSAYEWSKALALAGRAQCWRSETARKRILVQGLFYEDRWAECVRAGESSKDPEVNRWVKLCKRRAL
jgi:serine/threonine protein kinase